MHATTEQVTTMWNRYEREMETLDTELVERRIVNKNDGHRTRVTLYKDDLEGLRVGRWVGNTVIDLFAWKTFKRLDRARVPDIYTRSESWMVHLCFTCMGNMKNTITIHAVL
jgi:hypothetical protein